MIKRYVYELDVLKQKAGETAETNREKVGKLNQKLSLIHISTPMEWRLEYDSEQLRLLGVTLSDISEAVQRHYRKEFLAVSYTHLLYGTGK